MRNGTAITGDAGEIFWQDQEYHTAAGRSLRVLVAPSSSTHRRANTSDGLTFLLGRIPSEQRNHVLIITSSIYAPCQFLAGAPIVLSDGAEHVELVGTSTSTMPDWPAKLAGTSRPPARPASSVSSFSKSPRRAMLASSNRRRQCDPDSPGGASSMSGRSWVRAGRPR